MAAGIAYSGDGIHWDTYNGGKPVTYRAADCYNQIVWDPGAGLYRLLTRTDFGSGGGPLAGSITKTFEVRGARSMVNPDVEADPTNWKLVRQWIFDREGPLEYRRRQIYALTDWIYCDVHFALMSVYDWPGDVSEGKTTDHHKRHERDVMNFYIATSRDADRWDLTWVYAGRSLVPRGGDGAFDKDIVMPASTIVTYQDRHWIYYSGANERHGTHELDPPVTFKRQHAIGLATLRLDGFVLLEVADEQGVVVTKPFKFAGSRLELNADVRGGHLAVEVLNADAVPIAGFTLTEAAALDNVDGLRLAPSWRGSNDLASLKGKTVRLKFYLRHTKLYAFQVRP